MKGQSNPQPPLFACVQLEPMIPPDHILRRIRQAIDFTFVDELTTPLDSATGRPSVAPQVLGRLLVVGYLYGLTSERRLCEEVQLNLAYRWFCGLGLEDRVPDHSTFRKNRHGRFAGTDLFDEMFYAVVRQAMAHGLVRGTHLTAVSRRPAVALSAVAEALMPRTAGMALRDWRRRMEERRVDSRHQFLAAPRPLIIGWN